MSTQKQLMKRERVCVGCGETAVRAGEDRGYTPGGIKMLSLTCTIYRRPRNQKVGTSRTLRATSRVPICEECFVQSLMMGGKSKAAGKLFAAIREQLSATYNAMRKDSPE